MDGVYQQKDSYTVSGTTLTFDAAPANNVEIEVMSFTQTTVNTPAANSVGVTELNLSDGTNGQVLTTNGSGTLSFANGGVDGIVSNADATAITIDSSENVGIGITNPSTRTHIYSSASSTPLIVESTANTYVGIKNTTQTAYIGAVTSNMIFENNGAERMRIDSSGNVGIGITSPSGELHVDSGLAPCDIHFTTGSTGGTGYDVNLNLTGGANNSEMNLNMGIAGNADREQIKTYQSTMRFTTADTERMRIDSSGSLGLGTNNPGSLLHVAHSNGGVNPTARIENTTGTVATNSVLLDLKFSGDDSFSNCDYIKFQDYSGEEGVITGDGGGRVYYEITSDYRKKENIVDYTGGLDVINNLSVKNYNMITRPDITYTGFIAHEVQDVVDGVARGEKDAIDDEGNPIYQGLDMSKLVPHLVSAIQEQQALIEAQATTITDLTTRIETLENA